MSPNTYKIKTALISVSDKTGIVEFAKELVNQGVIIYSTGGTATLLKENGINVLGISELTNFPEILNGRVKTLHPAVHSGLLAELDKDEHIKTLEKHNLFSIDLLVVNLYPFEKVLNNLRTAEKFTSNSPTHKELIENIDIGGPTMLRSAAKNYKWTAVVVHPKHYNTIIDYIKTKNAIPEEFRLQLAGEVFNHTAQYDSFIANYFNEVNNIKFPENLTLSFKKEQDCRYGENPHQSAAVYGKFLNEIEKIHGKELSYNNVMDINAICELMLEFENDKPTVAIVKHTNPCGVASADNYIDAWDMAFATDTEAPFGGIVALNGIMDKQFAEKIHPLFTEVLIATDFTPDALEILTKKKDRRLIKVNYVGIQKLFGYSFRSLPAGMLYQQQDIELLNDMKVVSQRQPTAEEIENMLFAWKIVKHIKSNAILYCGKNRTLGVGAGQMSRVDSSRIAVEKAKLSNLSLNNSVMASDAFLPFSDALMEAVNAGATAIIQPGGSVRDEEVIATANEHNIAMIFTGMRHFKH